jgi:hypothetical protein
MEILIVVNESSPVFIFVYSGIQASNWDRGSLSSFSD